MGDLGNWNYLIGFGLFLLGLAISAHPSTPLGRGRGVVVGMLGCFLVGLLWICTGRQRTVEVAGHEPDGLTAHERSTSTPERHPHAVPISASSCSRIRARHDAAARVDGHR